MKSFTETPKKKPSITCPIIIKINQFQKSVFLKWQKKLNINIVPNNLNRVNSGNEENNANTVFSQKQKNSNNNNNFNTNREDDKTE